MSGAIAQTIVRDSSVRRASAGNTIMWIDAGAARTRQLERAATTGGIIGAGVRRATPKSVLHLDAAALVGHDSASAGQVLGAVALSPFLSGRFVTEVSGSLSSFRPTDDNGEGNRTLLLRQQIRHNASAWSMGLSLDGGIGTTKRDTNTEVGSTVDPEIVPFPATAHGVSAWLANRTVSLGARWQRIRTNDFPLIEAAGYQFVGDASAYDFDHFTASASYQRNRVTLQATAERQQGRSATIGHTTALAANVSIDIVPALTLMVGTGKQLADPLHGLPKAHYSSVGLRFTRARASSSAPITNTDREAWLELPPVTGGILIVQVRAPADAVVEIADSHNNWVPAAMERVGASFVARIPLPSGAHRVAIRVNKGEWRAPRGLARVVDDLGGAAGLVVVP